MRSHAAPVSQPAPVQQSAPKWQPPTKEDEPAPVQAASVVKSGPFAMRSHITAAQSQSAPVPAVAEPVAAAAPKWQPEPSADSNDYKPAAGTVAALKAAGPFGGNRVVATAAPATATPEPERKPAFTVAPNPACGVCGKPVYLMEMLEADGKKYHKR